MTHRPLWDRFAAVAAMRGDAPAVCDAASGETVGYADLKATAETWAARLGASDAPFVALIGEPDPAQLALVLGAAAAGKCLVPLNPAEPAHRLRAILDQLGAPALVATCAGPAFGDGPTVDLAGLTLRRHEPAHDTGPPGVVPFVVTHSSGSTGLPKPVAISQAAKLRRTDQSIGLFGITASDRVLWVSPLYHSLGQRHLMLALLTGAVLIRAFPFGHDRWIDAARRHRPTFAIPVATHLKVLHATLRRDPGILASFRTIVTSSAPAEAEFKRDVIDRATFAFWEIYGMTETACATAVRHDKGRDLSHLGAAIAGTQVRIAAPPGGVGEIEVRSDCLCDGYLNDPARWAAALTADGWFRSGDLGTLDAGGHLRFKGRMHESFESGGHVVFPAEIEAAMATLPGLAQCVACSVRMPIVGHAVALAWAAGADGAGLENRDILAHARQNLPRHLWPARLHRFDAFPLLGSGKPDRLAVRRMFDPREPDIGG